MSSRSYLSGAFLLNVCVAAATFADQTGHPIAYLGAVGATMPVAFTENRGQWPDSILYPCDGGVETM